MLNQDTKEQIRTYCGYAGLLNESEFHPNWRFYQAIGLLEYRLTHLTDAERNVVNRYIEQISQLNSSIVDSKSEEIQERIDLYKIWCRRLCGFLGIPEGPKI